MGKGKYQEWITEDGQLRLTAWARDGLTDEQIAAKIGITARTLYRWKEKYCQICQAIRAGAREVDTQVENALLDNARGYFYTEKVVSTKREVTYENGKRIKEISEPVVVSVQRWKPADTRAQDLWLKNRRPDKWRDRPEGSQGGEVVQIVDDIPKG